MFKATPANPYDDIVVKATDETLTSENWEINLNLCDKVQDEGEQGARDVIAAILKRLAHRNPNVQLYSFTLVESLSKNCGKELHQEIASRAFTQALERLITDRNTHDKVRNRALMLIAMWTEDFENDPTLGIMEECYESLKAKNYKFVHTDEPPPHDDDEARKREEEELERVLELSKQDKGGRKNWNEYSLASSNGAGGSGSQVGAQASTAHQPAAATSSSSAAAAAASAAHAHSTGYRDVKETPTQTRVQSHTQPQIQTHTQTTTPTTVESSPRSSVEAPDSPTVSTAEGYSVSRVRALHSFKPTEPNELAFERGDIIKVVNREYKDWWRGQLRGRTGIFPVNYVEPLPEPTADEVAAEAQQETAVFSQAANVDRLLTMLRTLDPVKDNLADNEEIQELYRSCMTLRPKIVKLIDKYSQKRADLISMNESFVRARTIFDRMMEESLTRHSEFYEQQQRTPFPQPQSPYPRAEHGQQAPGYGQPPDQPQAYGWNPSAYDQAGYNVFPNPTTPAYAQQRQGGPVTDPRVNLGRSVSYAARQSQPHGPPASQQVQQTPQPHVQAAYAQPYPPQDGARPPYYPQAPQQQAEAPLQPEQTPSPGQPQNQPSYPHPQQQPHIQSQSQATPSQTSLHAQPQTQTVAHQQQPQVQTQTPHAPSADTPAQAQTQAQAQPQAQKQQQSMTGPPFVFDPDATYPDQNVQAWAEYYAKGGTDPTGSVYFISVPGITDARAPPAAAAAVQATEGQQQQPQPQQQQQLQRAGSVSISSAAAPSVDTQVHLQRQDSLPNPYGALSPSSAEGVGGVQRQVSLPNPYGLNSPSSGENVGASVQRHTSLPNPYGMNSPLSAIGENVGGAQGTGGPASAGPEGPHSGARAPWQTATTTLAGQFAQMRVGGEPSVGA